MFYRFVRGLVGIFLLFVFRIKRIGQENVPKTGGAILAVNHKSNWDVVVVSVTCPRMLRFMAKSELFENKLFGGLIRRLGAFPIQRGKGDIGAIKGALSTLNSSHVMLMFPEGKRVRGEAVTDAKAGVAMLATRARVPVIPVYISGKYKWMSKITVKYGSPILFDEYYDKKLTMDELQTLSNDVLRKMRSLSTENKIMAGK
ncbi:MAG: 1-acyl-sn-glycerol-3-phosphate acyltransferase [Clostridia bacterium]|nr:1-acyl-sn-glycerol-3-phosphate acyltransferase [Clostridia bacterium]